MAIQSNGKFIQSDKGDIYSHVWLKEYNIFIKRQVKTFTISCNILIKQ